MRLGVVLADGQTEVVDAYRDVSLDLTSVVDVAQQFRCPERPLVRLDVVVLSPCLHLDVQVLDERIDALAVGHELTELALEIGHRWAPL